LFVLLFASLHQSTTTRESEFLSILARARSLSLSLSLSLSVSVRVCLVRGSCLLSPRSSAGGLVLECAGTLCVQYLPTYIPTYLLTYLPTCLVKGALFPVPTYLVKWTL
jgi:hypothetical protein